MNISGKNIIFKYPDNPYVKSWIQVASQGQDYPILNLAGYSPKVIIDVGANIGLTTLLFQKFYPKASIYAFEPDSESFEYLNYNISSFDNIKAFNFGLFNKECEMPLFKGIDISIQNSVIKNRESTNISNIVKLKKLSEFLDKLNTDRISIIKIDTEGCEVPILNDIKDRIQNVDIIYVEYHSEDDRLSIENLLSKDFILFRAKADYLHRGTNAYISKNLVKRYSHLEVLKIEPFKL